MSHLDDYGWRSFFQRHVANSARGVPARVIEEQRSAYRVTAESGEAWAEIAGNLRQAGASVWPAVGDWVLIESRGPEGRARIHEVLPRFSVFSRQAAGRATREQVVAANIDVVFLMTSLNADLNPRRTERYLTTIRESGAQPVVLLNKADLCGDLSAALRELGPSVTGVPVHTLSALMETGLEDVRQYLRRGVTAALAGSSGVGKSTLINSLLGRSLQQVRDIRENDARGRHTTTSRRLFLLPAGGMLIDTPGMRELQPWSAAEGLLQTFEDVAELSLACRFRDCRHLSEPGCAVRAAIHAGQLDQGRVENYFKLGRELEYQGRRQDVLARIDVKRRWKQIHKAQRRKERTDPKSRSSF